MIRPRVLTAAVTVLVVAAVAVILVLTLRSSGGPRPRAIVAATPSEAGSPVTLSTAVVFGGARGELTELEIDLARGLRYDPRAADVCAAAQARLGRCPRSSIVGRGTGEIVVTGSRLPRSAYVVGATFYNAAAGHTGDLAGIALDLFEGESRLHAVLFGRVAPLPGGAYGVAIRFARGDHELPGTYTLSLRRLTTTLGAVKRSGSATYRLLTDASPCPVAGWPLQVSMRSGTQVWAYRGRAPCHAP